MATYDLERDLNPIFGSVVPHVSDLILQVTQLELQNVYQWALEDVSRRYTGEADYAAAGAIKAAIDTSNRRRVLLIHTIDKQLKNCLAPTRDTQSAPEGRRFLASESLGQMVDRLTIIAIRLECCGRREQPIWRSEYRYLLNALAMAVDSASRGWVSFPPAFAQKHYNGRALIPASASNQ